MEKIRKKVDSQPTSSLRVLAAYNYLLHFSRYIMPFFVMPYLSRVLGTDAYGLVFLAISLGLTLSIVIEYGFAISASRELSQVRDDPSRVASLVSSVTIAKLLLCAVCIVFAVVLIMFTPRLLEAETFSVVGVLYALSVGLTPMWYYQANERMRFQSGLEIGCQFLAMLCVFFLVKGPQDAILAPILQLIGSVSSTSIGYFVLFRKVNFESFSIKKVRRQLVSGFNLFLLRGFYMLYSTSNSFLVGVILGPADLAFFGIAERLYTAGCGLFSPMAQALFPRVNYLMAHDPVGAFRVVRFGSLVMFFIGIIVMLGTYLIAPLVIAFLFGKEFSFAADLLKTLCLAFPFFAVSQIIGIQVLLPMKLEKIYNLIIGVSGILSAVGAIVSLPQFGVIAMAYVRLLAEISIAAMMMIYVVIKRVYILQQFGIQAPYPGIKQ